MTKEKKAVQPVGKNLDRLPKISLMPESLGREGIPINDSFQQPIN